MKKLLMILGVSVYITLSVADTSASPWRPRNRKCYITPNGDLVKIKEKSNRMVIKTYRNGKKISARKVYREPSVKLDNELRN